MVGSSGTFVDLTTSTTAKGYIIGKNSTSTGWNGTFYVSTAYFQGGVLYQGSDERFKEFVGDIDVDFEALKSIPKKYFVWKKGAKQGEGVYIGTSAQKLKEVYPELVSDDGDIMSVAYENLSIVALAAIDKLHAEIERLEARIQQLESR